MGLFPFESILFPYILGLFWDLVILDLLKLGKYIRDTQMQENWVR